VEPKRLLRCSQEPAFILYSRQDKICFSLEFSKRTRRKMHWIWSAETFCGSILYCHDLGMCETYKTGSGLDDWIYWHLIHTTRDYMQYSAIVDLHPLQFTLTHALEFSVFTSRILATDLPQSHCHFKSHMKSVLRRLIPFLLLFCNCQLNSVSLLPSSYPGRLASRNSTNPFQPNSSF
jgi:hypothetical protein